MQKSKRNMTKTLTTPKCGLQNDRVVSGESVISINVRIGAEKKGY